MSALSLTSLIPHQDVQEFTIVVCPHGADGVNVVKYAVMALQKSYRYVIRPPKYGGLQCPDHHKLVRERPCNIRSCDCHVTPWDDWSCCTQQCADPKYDPPQPGTQFTTRRVVLKPLRNGMACPGLNKAVHAIKSDVLLLVYHHSAKQRNF